MFPNLRLIIGAAIATIALVMIMGSGVLSFRDPYHSIADVPDVRRPLVQHAIVENPDRRQFRSLASARRNDELQRLLDLPSSPIQAYAPEPPTAFPFKVMAPADNPLRSGEPAAAAVERNPPKTQTLSSPPAIDLSALPPSVSEGVAVPPAVRDSTDATAVAPISSAMPPSPDNQAPARPSGAASAEPAGDAPAANDETGAIPASSVPAIERPPLPPIDPRIARPREESSSSAGQPASSRAKPRRIVQTVRTPPRRARRAPVANPAAATQQEQTSPFDNNGFNQRPYNIQ